LREENPLASGCIVGELGEHKTTEVIGTARVVDRANNVNAQAVHTLRRSKIGRNLLGICQICPDETGLTLAKITDVMVANHPRSCLQRREYRQPAKVTRFVHDPLNNRITKSREYGIRSIAILLNETRDRTATEGGPVAIRRSLF
jgi:hypothetical protein